MNPTGGAPPAGARLLRRHPGNPVLAAVHVPYPATLVFGPGVVRYRGRYLMAFRVDHGGRPGCERFASTVVGLADSDDGVAWKVRPAPWLDWRDDEIVRIRDPRLAVIDDLLHLTCALDTRHGVRAAVSVSDDLETWTPLDVTRPGCRDLALFQQRARGALWRLERPLAAGGDDAPEGFDLWCSTSPDGVHWGRTRLVLGRERLPWANAGVGPGTPPLLLHAGWLTFVRVESVDRARELPAWHRGWCRASAVVALLLDPEEPWRVRGMCREPVLVPAAPYELNGFHGHALSPGAAVLERSGEVRVYYGAADTCVALATGDSEEIVERCLADGPPAEPPWASPAPLRTPS